MHKLKLQEIAARCGYTEIAKQRKLLDDLESNIMDKNSVNY